MPMPAEGRSLRCAIYTRKSTEHELERLVEATLRDKLDLPNEQLLEQVETIIVSEGKIRLALKQSKRKRGLIEIPWTPTPRATTQVIASSDAKIDQKLVKSIIRAHAWLDDLSSGRHGSVEDLAISAGLHPKVVRQGLRLAFLVPDLTSAALDGNVTIGLKEVPKLLPLSWREQHRSVGKIG